MCKSCNCSTSGLNPRQMWYEMAESCMATKGEPEKYECKGSLCDIQTCPRLDVGLPKDTVSEPFEDGTIYQFFGSLRSEAERKARAVENGPGEVKREYAGWVPYKGYVVFMVGLRKMS